MTAAIKASPRPELAVPWVGDLADPAARDALLAEAASALGRVTHFVHSASPPRREADHVLGVSTETWAQMHAVNLEAGFHLSRELARKLIAGKAARLVPAADLAACRHPAQPAALLDVEGGAFDAGEGTGQDVWPLRHPRQRAGARRDRGRRLRRRSRARKTHSARPARPGRRTLRRWRWRCCRTGYRPTSRAPRSWSTAACR